jgi:hypothetical protein
MKLLPYNDDLEKEILGMSLLSSTAADKIIEQCDSSYFYKDNHKNLFRTIKRMRKYGKPVDMISLSEEAGDSLEIAEIGNRGITDANLDYRIRQIKEIVNKRKMIITAQSILDNKVDLKRAQEIFSEIECDVNDHSSILHAEKVRDEIINYYQCGGEKGLSPGWTSFNELYRISKGQITLITGIPGHGKSEILDAIAINLAKSYNWKFMFFSPENHPVSRHARKLIEKYSGIPFFEGYNSRLTEDELLKSIEWLNNHFCFLVPEPGYRTVDFLLSQIKDVDGFILDPWNEVESKRPEGMTETEYISQALAKIKAVAIQRDIHIWIVAHPTKLQKNEAGEYPVPTPYDVSGSANWRNKSDNILSIYRNMDEHQIEIHVLKIRFKDNGKLGIVNLKYNPVNGQFSKLPDEELCVNQVELIK